MHEYQKEKKHFIDSYVFLSALLFGVSVALIILVLLWARWTFFVGQNSKAKRSVFAGHREYFTVHQ
jgi:hypothetical protein